MKKIFGSVVTIAAVAAIVFGATSAFFSDTETSTGNRFEAGVIDLRIDNESYAIDWNIPGFNEPAGELVANPDNSWDLSNLTIEKFFDFVDLKPGDYGEDTISIHVGSNDAWLCAAAQITQDDDNGFTEPEDEVFGANNDNDDGTPDGDLDSALNFAFWVDDGDNVLEGDEVANVFLSGPLSDMGQAGQITIADSGGSILPLNDGPVPGDSEFYIAKAWCFGTLSPDPVDQDDLGKQDGAANGPLVRGTGVDCDGSSEGNIAQTDIVVGDLEFYAEQSRNNNRFVCSSWSPSWTQNN